MTAEEMNAAEVFGAPEGMSEEEVSNYIHATTDLIGRSGASGFMIGCMDTNAPIAEAKWYVQAEYKGARIFVENMETPWAAMLTMTERLLTGAKCKCGKLVATTDDGAFAFSNPTMTDGESFTVEQAQAAGFCRWRLARDKWIPGCNR
jgi:hypothetical protein